MERLKRKVKLAVMSVSVAMVMIYFYNKWSVFKYKNLYTTNFIRFSLVTILKKMRFWGYRFLER